MVKAKITLDNEQVREIKDCDLLVAIGLDNKGETYRIQASVMGGGLEGARVLQGLADGVAEAINSLADSDHQAIRMLTVFVEVVENRCNARILERLKNGD